MDTHADLTATQDDGLHTAVSNSQDAARDRVEKDLLSDLPSTGEGDAVAPGEDGFETVAPSRSESAQLTEVAPDLTGLRPIGEASFGPQSSAESVLGVDDRVQIPNTHQYPWSAHASLLVTARDGSRWIGTGWFIGPRTLVTAGHVVFIKNSGVPGRDGWVQSVLVMPGRNGSSLPFGSVSSSNLRSVTGWTNGGDHEYDYGAILLSTDLGSRTGTLGFGAYTDATLLSSTANISGYPGDKPSGTQWYHSSRVQSVGPRKIYYTADTFGGQSGSAVYRIDNGQRYAMGVHAYGGRSNSATRITRGVYDNLVAWKS